MRADKSDEWRYRIPKTSRPGMRVDGIVYASAALWASIENDPALEQVIRVACLPGIVGASLAMPDIHWGYGFPIGGVAATDIAAGGVISPGGVGFDINCGVRLLRTGLNKREIAGRGEQLCAALFQSIPAGVGSKGELRLSATDEKKVLRQGAAWAVAQGFGIPEDLAHTEEQGRMHDADPAAVTPRAYERGRQQAGTLGAGNHFIEVQYVEKIFDPAAAAALGLREKQLTVMIHSGSRGLGHQVCTEYVQTMITASRKYGISVTDRQLACAPLDSPEGRDYLGAMNCAANYAWANRQVLMHRVRETFERFFHAGWRSLDMTLVYDVAHNMAKIEEHEINGQKRRLCVHRKGATRAFGPGNPGVPDAFRVVGQPVIIPGDMGRCSYVLAGTERAMQDTFGSTCHGAGRIMSRSAAIRSLRAKDVLRELQQAGIAVHAAGKETICEEAPQAYKDVNQVVEVVHEAGISRKICRLKPLAVIKG